MSGAYPLSGENDIENIQKTPSVFEAMEDERLPWRHQPDDTLPWKPAAGWRCGLNIISATLQSRHLCDLRVLYSHSFSPFSLLFLPNTWFRITFPFTTPLRNGGFQRFNSIYQSHAVTRRFLRKLGKATDADKLPNVLILGAIWQISTNPDKTPRSLLVEILALAEVSALWVQSVSDICWLLLNSGQSVSKLSTFLPRDAI